MLGHEQPNLAIIITTKCQKICGSLLHRTGIAETHAHQTAFALVRQALAHQLDHHRKAEALSSSDCLWGVRHDRFAGEPRAVGSQHLLGFVFAQCA